MSIKLVKFSTRTQLTKNIRHIFTRKKVLFITWMRLNPLRRGTKVSPQPRKNSFRLSAERFCDVHLIEYQVCLNPDVRARGSFNKYCPKPSGFDVEKMNQCKAKVVKFFEFTVSERVEEMNLELLESAK